LNPYLKASLTCFTLCALILIYAFSSVPASLGAKESDMFGWWKAIFKTKGTPGVCRHEATYAITVMGEKYPVRVAGGDYQGARHAQAQAWINGEWRWLAVDYGVVSIVAEDPNFRHSEYYVPWVWYQMILADMVPENRHR